MKLSTRTRYGTRALLELSLNHGKGLVQLRDIAQRQQISLSYLEHLIRPLVNAGIIRTTRGVGGGVSLTKPPEEVRLSEVIRLLEGSIALTECINNPELCPQSGFCVTRDIWGEMSNSISSVAESITLQDLVDRYRNKRRSQTPMYDI